MNISEESLKYLANLFNGDIEKFYTYKNGPKIFRFFNKYFNYNDFYSFNNTYPSRWKITYNKIVELWNKDLFNKFITIILSISYLKIEYPEKNVDDLSRLSKDIIEKINKVFDNDNNKIVKFSDCFKILPINEDERFLGEGGYACCYYIISKNLVEKRLKEENYIDNDVVHRFKREYDITKSLNDMDGIIKVYDFNQKNLSYTMERGECDLYYYIMHNELNEDNKKKIIYQIVYIINEVHKRNIIHRDLSPNNIFILSGKLKIADFGLGKDLNAFYSHQTMKTNSVGQYYYCDPKQFMKLKEGDKLSDIYSIGKIINFIMEKNPNSMSHKYFSVVEKATCDDLFRYKNLDELMEGLKKIDDFKLLKEYENKFILKIEKKELLDEVDIQYIKSFNAFKMFNMIKNINFRIMFVELKEKELIDEKTFLEKLEYLNEYYKNNFNEHESYDNIGYFGMAILFSKCSYISKEIAIKFINYAINHNRYYFIEMVKKEVIGNIDPTLEEKLEKVF